MGDERLRQEGTGRDNPRIGGQRGGAFDGLDAWRADSGIAHVMRTAKAREGRAAGALGGIEGWSWGEHSAEDGGVLVLQPVQHLRKGSRSSATPSCGIG